MKGGRELEKPQAMVAGKRVTTGKNSKPKWKKLYRGPAALGSSSADICQDPSGGHC